MNYNPFSLDGKTILVTGGSSGIGKAVAIECSKLGAQIIVTGRNKDRLNDTYGQLEGSGNMQVVADLTIEDELKQLVSQIPVLSGVVQAAGIVKTIPFMFVNKNEIRNIFNTNFFAPVLLSQALLKSKKITKGGSIVFLSSIDGPISAHVGNSMYAASKGAVSAMAKSMAVDLASKKIRVNCVLPGMTETPLIHGAEFTQEHFDSDMKLYPLKRYGQPKEIAYAVIYFLSDASEWTTGANLIVDGGFTLI